MSAYKYDGVLGGLYAALQKRQPWERTLLAAGLACAFFTVLEVLLYWSCTSLLTSWFAANPRLSKQQAYVASGQAISRILGAVHNMIQIPLSLILLRDPTLLAQPLYGATPLSTLLMAVSSGFFWHDLITCLRRWDGWSYTLHAAGCLSVFTYGLHTETLHYNGAAFLLWELSTFFVHARWFLFKLGKADTQLYVANGIAMIVTFFFVRNIFGTYISIVFWQDTARELANPHRTTGMTTASIYIFRSVNWMLNGLNAFWLWKMVQAATRVLLLGQKSSKVSSEKDE